MYKISTAVYNLMTGKVMVFQGTLLLYFGTKQTTRLRRGRSEGEGGGRREEGGRKEGGGCALD